MLHRVTRSLRRESHVLNLGQLFPYKFKHLYGRFPEI
jgi:hypothetical protein